MRRKTRAVRRMAMGIGIFDEAALLVEPQSGGGNVVRHGIDFEKHGFPRSPDEVAEEAASVASAAQQVVHGEMLDVAACREFPTGDEPEKEPVFRIGEKPICVVHEGVSLLRGRALLEDGETLAVELSEFFIERMRAGVDAVHPNRLVVGNHDSLLSFLSRRNFKS